MAKQWLWALALTLSAAWLSIGCSPGTLGMMLLPFWNDNLPARFPLASSEQENVIAIVTNFTSTTTRLELLPAETELTELFAKALRERCKSNKEKIKIVSPSRVRSYQKKMTGVVTDHDIGREFKADYVVAIDINSLDVFEPRSPQFLRGRAEFDVRVTDMKRPADEARVFEDHYRKVYPGENPVEASSTTPDMFRAEFLAKVSSDLARWFTKYPSTERLEME